ncbi:MAG: hypothetical protein ICV59_06905 [Thermoleophilia bacterium]|nr:hypothetical protein [Thermoleophilia bacterium]
MTLSDDHSLVGRLERVADPIEGADWLDVRRRARRSRLGALALVAAALLTLAVAIPASGLDAKVAEWLRISEGDDVVPTPARGPAISFVYGDRLHAGGKPVARLRASRLAPLLGTKPPLAVSSPDGRYVVYHTWAGRLRGAGAPTLRVYDRRTKRDRLLERGAQSFAWHPRRGLAYMRATKPVYRPEPPRGLPGGGYGHVVVRPSLEGAAVRWTHGPPGQYQVLGWAGPDLLVAVAGSNLQVAQPSLAPGVYAFAGPRRNRRLPMADALAISPDGRRIVGAASLEPAGPGSSELRLVRVRDGRVLATLGRRALARLLPDQEFPRFDGPGAWAGKRVVLTSADAIVVVAVGARRLAIERVFRVRLPIERNRYLGPWAYAPVFIGRSSNLVAVRIDLARRDETSGFSVFVTCEIDVRTCRGGRRLSPPTRWAAIVHNPSRPLRHP